MGKRNSINNIKYKTVRKITANKKAASIVLFTLYLILGATIATINRKGANFLVGGVAISGVITAFQIVIASFLTVVDFYIGGILATLLLCVSLSHNIIGIVATGNLSALPGAVYYVAGIIIVTIIRTGMRNFDKITSVDRLTNALNRRYILDSIDVLIRKNTPIYAVYITLDHFKFINDTEGHEKGDEVLRGISSEWMKVCKKDYLFGRIGGDEFLLVVPANKNNDIENIAEQLLYAFNKWKEAKHMPVYLTSSIGIASFPQNATSGQELISKSGHAMITAKGMGNNRYCMYSDDFDDEIVKQANIEMRIVDALARDKFYMVYQPQFETKTKKLRGFEALIRMNPGNEDFLSPGDFIPVAEKTDLIIKIGNFVLNRTTQDFADIIAQHPDLILSINVSAKQLLSGLFVDQLKNALSKSSFPAENLEVEITEYCLLDATDEVVEVIEEIKALGIKLAMDDFGTGYSSFSYLTKLPIDLIKIDKSIIDTMEEGVIVEAIVSMGHALDCEVISEGVEDEKQVEILRNTNCDLIQGFVWGKPLNLKEVKTILE